MSGSPSDSTVEPDLLRFVWRNSRADQIAILILTVAAFPLLYFSLELPKIIINDAISGTGFPREILGLEFAQTPYLLILCFTFLGTVILINVLKWFMNVKVGMTGERMLRRLRFSLFSQVMRFPPQRFRDTRPGEVVQSIMGEIEPIGGFIGEIIATPVYQGGMLVVYVAFIFVQDPVLGLAALALYPLQVAIIPRLQRKIIVLNRMRAGNTRKLADSLSGAVGGIDDIRVNGAERWHMGQISGRLHTNTDIRQQLFKRKFTIKFVNNLLNQLTPFLFFSIGGAMVIAGRLDLGALVAVLAAYKDISKPWREIMSFQQRWTDFKGRFSYAVEHFGGHDLASPARLEAEADAAAREGGLTLERIEVGEGSEAVTVPALSVAPRQLAALADGDSGARLAVLRAAAGVDAPVRGTVRVGALDLARASAASLGSAVGYVAADPVLLDASIRQNMVYGLLRRPAWLDDSADREAAFMREEARRTGAPPFDPNGDWVDYAAAGVRDAAALDGRLVELADAAGMGGELAAAALGARIDAAGGAPLLRALLGVRESAQSALAEAGLADAVDVWNRDAYCESASLLENILFALPIAATAPDSDPLYDTLSTPLIAKVLRETGAEDLLAEVGVDIARELAELVAALGEDSAALDQLGGFGRADAAAASELAGSLPPRGAAPRKGRNRRAVVALGARFTALRDGFDVLGPERRERAMALRAACAPQLADVADVARFDDPEPPRFFTVAEVLSGGRRRLDRRSAWKRLDATLESAADRAGLRPTLLVAGLLRPAGPGGSRLSVGMRRRVALLRALLKRPQALVLAGAFGGGSAEDAAMRKLARAEAPQAAILLSADDETVCADADLVARLDAQGAFEIDAPAVKTGGRADIVETQGS
jgi:putative ABC transport system ATP-binding protein